MIEAREVELRFGPHAALAGVDVALPERGLVSVIGPSGSGKSSLLHVLAGLRRPTAGDVTLNGRPLAEYSTAQLRSERFAFIFQDHFLVMYLTGLENVVGAVHQPTSETRERATAILHRLGIGEEMSRYAWRMSGGERQRIAVARAFVRGFDHLFADEPTAALDRESARMVYQLLREAAAKHCVVLVTHDPEAIEMSDRVIELRDGRLVENRAAGRQTGRRGRRTKARH